MIMIFITQVPCNTLQHLLPRDIYIFSILDTSISRVTSETHRGAAAVSHWGTDTLLVFRLPTSTGGHTSVTPCILTPTPAGTTAKDRGRWTIWCRVAATVKTVKSSVRPRIGESAGGHMCWVQKQCTLWSCALSGTRHNLDCDVM